MTVSQTTANTIPTPPTGGAGGKGDFSDFDWPGLLRELRHRQVVPVIGPELVTVPDKKGEEVTLYRVLAEKLAKKLDLTINVDEPRLNDVACAHLSHGGQSKIIYDELRDLVVERTLALEQPPKALLDLASVKEELQTNINVVWTCVAAFLVFFMQAGFGMVEAGFIRAKNTTNILTKNFLDFCMASLGYFAVGYALIELRQRALEPDPVLLETWSQAQPIARQLSSFQQARGSSTFPATTD